MPNFIYQQRLPGKSNAHLLTLPDGKSSVVKFLQEGFEKSLANEWIGYCIGRYLGAPLPFSQIISLPEDFTRQIHHPEPLLSAQHQFATTFIPDSRNLHEITDSKSITNPETVVMIILLDYWLVNHDRTRKNILLQETEPGAYRIWAIDHAEIFSSPSWTLNEMNHPHQGLIKSATHQFLCRFIDKEERFYEGLEIIQTMPVLLLEEIVAHVPDDWLLTKEERKAITAFLVHRRKKSLPKLIERFIKKIYYPIKNELNCTR